MQNESSFILFGVGPAGLIAAQAAAMEDQVFF